MERQSKEIMFRIVSPTFLISSPHPIRAVAKVVELGVWEPDFADKWAWSMGVADQNS